MSQRPLMLFIAALSPTAAGCIDTSTPGDSGQAHTVDQVGTAIPAFVGFTELGGPVEPVAIQSMDDFERELGGPPAANSGYVLHSSVALYFANGGEHATIVPVGSYTDAPTTDHFQQGLDALKAADSPTLVLLPDAASALSAQNLATVHAAALDHCATMADRLCILDLANTDQLDDAVDAFRSSVPLTHASFGAAYVPWLDVGGVAIPPSGAVAGVIAQIDAAEGVWTAPVNVPLMTVVGTTHAIDEEAQDALTVDAETGVSINAIRTFDDAGPVVWGARTLAGNDNEWRYVPVRRLGMMVQESLRESMQWAADQPNDQALWDDAAAMTRDYLEDLYRQGAFQGATSDDAYFVYAGLGESMTQSDIDNGRMVVGVGFAPTRPAEFILLDVTVEMSAR